MTVADTQISGEGATSEWDTISVEFRDGIEIVTLNRPPVNAVNPTMMQELERVFASYETRDDVRAVVLAANEERAFCGGIDLKGLNAEDETLKDRLNPGWQWRQTQHVIRHAAVPVIAAVETNAVGAGLGLIGVVDIVIAARTARLALPEINVGLLGGASKALKLVGPAKTRMMMFLGEPVSAEEFYRLGAIEAIVEPGEALNEALRIAGIIATKSPVAMRLAKESILRIETDWVEEQYRTEWDYTNRLARFEDSKEALAAYMEKRAPQWALR